MEIIIQAIHEIIKKKVSHSKYIDLIIPSGISEADVNKIISEIGDGIKLRMVYDHEIVSGFKLIYGDFELDASMDSKAEDLADFLKKKLSGSAKDTFLEELTVAVSEYKSKQSVVERGVVKSIKDGVCIVDGLRDCMYQELVLIDGKFSAIAMNIEKNQIGTVLLDLSGEINIGDKVERTKRVVSVGVSEDIIGRIVDPLGNPIDGKSSIKADKFLPVEKVAPDVISRKPVDRPLLTGITAIDALIPIGRGQRELILGDRQTGKTSIVMDTIINQKGKDIICIYASIGQKESKLARIADVLRETGAMEYTIIVSSSASDSATRQFLTPYSATAIGEYFLEKGKDVLIIYDDLTKHAVAYRELSLLLRRPPGREAYPGDVFYLHSRLLERSCSLSDDLGGGSITSLPIIETQAGDISAYIPTNVISITDGQIFLETDLFYKGVRPAINVGLSVSRVGSAAQTKPMKKVAGKLKVTLAQFRELEAFSQFAGELDQNTKDILERGKKIVELLKQTNNSPRTNTESVITIFAVNKGIFDKIKLEEIREVNTKMQEYIAMFAMELVDDIDKNKWDEIIETKLHEICQEFLKSYKDGFSKTN
jgi:F-type H+-transporting ATPase subunit alpha